MIIDMIIKYFKNYQITGFKGLKCYKSLPPTVFLKLFHGNKNY